MNIYQDTSLLTFWFYITQQQNDNVIFTL